MKNKKPDFKLRQQIETRDNHRCVACWKSDNLRIDHIVPNGDNAPDNLQTLCHSCNLSKGERTFETLEAFRNWRYVHGYPIYAILKERGFFNVVLETLEQKKE